MNWKLEDGASKYDEMFNLIHSLGGKLNDNSGKFAKGRFMELVLCNTIPNCEHVDQIGYDLQTPDKKIEVKSQQGCLFTKKKGEQKEKTASIRIKNFKGEGNITVEETCSLCDEYYFIDTLSPTTYSLAKIESNKLTDKNIAEWFASSDGLNVKIKTQYLDFLCRPKDITIYNSKEATEHYDVESNSVIMASFWKCLGKVTEEQFDEISRKVKEIHMGKSAEPETKIKTRSRRGFYNFFTKAKGVIKW